ncbi:MAG: OmpA family protein [Planctomycetaceae bacterium]|nr:OmpA family protein [Planctomycetaceae bacterium]
MSNTKSIHCSPSECSPVGSHASKLMLAAVLSITGCCGGRGGDDLTSAQLHARDLYAENARLQAALNEATAAAQGLGCENQALMSQLAENQGQVSALNDRLKNLADERAGLADRYAKALNDTMTDPTGNPALAGEGFDYDPATGLHRFRSDILFDLGSDAIRPEAGPTIKEFASSVTAGSAKGLRILIVGHTDDQNIVRPETALKHPTNWHLSTDRADAVILELLKLGVEPDRIASMGYSEFHPLEKSTTEPARQRNRRVELFVVPSDPNVARWDPANAIR